MKHMYHLMVSLDGLRIVMLYDLFSVIPFIEGCRFSDDQVKSSSIQVDHFSVVTDIIELVSDTQ